MYGDILQLVNSYTSQSNTFAVPIIKASTSADSNLEFNAIRELLEKANVSLKERVLFIFNQIDRYFDDWESSRDNIDKAFRLNWPGLQAR